MSRYIVVPAADVESLRFRTMDGLHEIRPVPVEMDRDGNPRTDGEHILPARVLDFLDSRAARLTELAEQPTRTREEERERTRLASDAETVDRVRSDIRERETRDEPVRTTDATRERE